MLAIVEHTTWPDAVVVIVSILAGVVVIGLMIWKD